MVRAMGVGVLLMYMLMTMLFGSLTLQLAVLTLLFVPAMYTVFDDVERGLGWRTAADPDHLADAVREQ
jgi:hypothetical protein